MKKRLYFCMALFLLIMSVVSAYSQAVSEEFVRFHILADSNSPYDQLVKINLRDYIFTVFENDLKNCVSKEETLNFLRQNKENIKKHANLFLKNIGYDKETDVYISKGYFPKKDYSDFILPYGEYDSLKIIIGSGKGKNFFCVMFPPACVSKEMTEKVNQILDGRKITYKLKLFQKGA